MSRRDYALGMTAILESRSQNRYVAWVQFPKWWSVVYSLLSIVWGILIHNGTCGSCDAISRLRLRYGWAKFYRINMGGPSTVDSYFYVTVYHYRPFLGINIHSNVAGGLLDINTTETYIRSSSDPYAR